MRREKVPKGTKEHKIQEWILPKARREQKTETNLIGASKPKWMDKKRNRKAPNESIVPAGHPIREEKRVTQTGAPLTRKIRKVTFSHPGASKTSGGRISVVKDQKTQVACRKAAQERDGRGLGTGANDRKPSWKEKRKKTEPRMPEKRLPIGGRILGGYCDVSRNVQITGDVEG